LSLLISIMIIIPLCTQVEQEKSEKALPLLKVREGW